MKGGKIMTLFQSKLIDNIHKIVEAEAENKISLKNSDVFQDNLRASLRLNNEDHYKDVPLNSNESSS